MLPRQGQVKGVHHYQAIIMCNVKGTYLFKKKKIKTMNIKMAIHSQLLTIESKKQTKQTNRTETES